VEGNYYNSRPSGTDHGGPKWRAINILVMNLRDWME
jgi:hypothetical protein